MIRSEVRAQVAANQAGSTKGADGPDGQAANGPAVPPPEANRLGAAPGLPRPPWLVRNSRKAASALVLAILAASPFAYLYLQRNFGPDPLAGIKLDGVRFDAITGMTEAVRPADVKPAQAKHAAAAGAIESVPKPLPPRHTASAAGPLTVAPGVAAAGSGVTHTKPGGAAPVAPPVAAPGARDGSVATRANARAEATVSGACTEAVAALGFCNLNATGKGN